jgi:hypothetical protein
MEERCRFPAGRSPDFLSQQLCFPFRGLETRVEPVREVLPVQVSQAASQWHFPIRESETVWVSANVYRVAYACITHPL